MPTLVKNLNATSERKCTLCGSWAEHWKKLSGKAWPKECGKCSNKPTLGAHVKKADSSDNSHYIVPLCDECNSISSSEYFNVYEELVDATPCKN